jgi:hypothetical protein
LEQHEKVENLKKIYAMFEEIVKKKEKLSILPSSARFFWWLRIAKKAMTKNMVLNFLWKISKTKMKI